MGTLRLGPFLFPMVVHGLGMGIWRPTLWNCNPTGFLAHFLFDAGPLVVVYGVYVVGRQRRHLEARFFSSSGGCVWRAGSRASA